MVVLYRATGVLNLAFGAVGAMGALLAWQLINNNSWQQGPAFLVCVLSAEPSRCLRRDLRPTARGPRSLVKATATLGLALILLGSWTSSGATRRAP
jgi:branched-chain amino acid transport system permease protein